MSIEEVLDVMDELLDNAWSLPLSGGRCVVDADRVRDLIDDMRINMPAEIRQAQAIAQDRAEIISTAKREAEGIIRRAEERAKALVAQEEVAKAAQKKAADIMTQTQVKSREMRLAAHEFSDGVLKATEDAMRKSLEDLRSARQALRNSAKQN